MGPQQAHKGNRSVTYFNVVLLILCWLADPALATPHRHTLEARQSSDGCGQNPLVALLSYAPEFSPQQLVKFIETDVRAWNQLRSLLRTYDDCVRTGDGTRYKRPSPDHSSKRIPIHVDGHL